MKKYNKTNFHIQQRNQHLKNILDEAYYLELGTLDISTLEKIFNGEVIALNDIIYKDITFEGTGRIIGPSDNEMNLQLDFLDSLRKKSTSHKIFLTIGVLRYTVKEVEYYAPMVLVPVEINLINKTIVMTGEAIGNTLVINDIQAQYAININTLPKNASLYDVNSYCESIAKNTGFFYFLSNYLTVVSIEYNDANISFEELAIQRSIYEQTSLDVYKLFFNKVKAIKHTNIYQKWVLLKIANGESFIVDGKLGTGKTYTIINALADAIQKNNNKKILYVSQDRTNVDDVYKELDDYHLSSYVYNLCQDISYENSKHEEFENIREENVGLETLYPIVEYENALNASIHRCRYTTIISELARIKNANPMIQPIRIDAYLESNELKNVHQELVEIENILDVIEPLDVNVWSSIEQYYTEQHAPEIKKSVKNYLQATQTFNKQIKSYCKKYGINLPSNFLDAQKLLSYIQTFTKMLPPSCWVTQFNSTKIDELLKSIKMYQQQYKNIKDQVLSKVVMDYQADTVKHLMDIICFKHLNLNDEKYLQNILSGNEKIKLIIITINKSLAQIELASKKLMSSVQVLTIGDVELEYFRKFSGLLSLNAIHDSWINFYNNQVNVKKHFTEMSELLEKYLSIKKYLSSFLLKEDSINYRSFKLTTLSRDYNKQFIALFDKKMLKKSKVTTDNIISSIFDMIECGDKIKEIIEKNNLVYSKELDEFIVTYGNWINFINSLSTEELSIFKKQALKNKASISFKEEFLKSYNEFITNEKILTKQYNDLQSFGVVINGNNIIEKNRDAIDWLEYLRRTTSSIDQLVQIFKDSTPSYDDVMLIINCDDEYNKLLSVLKARDKEMKHYLGTSYAGLNTNCDLIKTLVKHYALFVSLLDSKDRIKLLYQDNLMDGLVNDFPKLNQMMEEKLEAHNKFSRYFSGGLHDLLAISLDQSLKRILVYDDHISELEPVFTIFKFAHHFDKLGLISLSDGILSSTYQKGISSRFIYSVYLEYKNELINDKPILAENGSILTWLENYKYFENNYCKTNLRDLERNKPKIDEKLMKQIEKIPFNDYDRIIDELINVKNIFLCDVNIFNSQMDLSKFDIVFVDDVHLSSSNKYNHIDEVKQIVLFGDSSTKDVRVNNIFAMAPEKNSFSLFESYINDNMMFNNIINHKNQYILDFNKQLFVKQFDSNQDIIKEIVKSFNQNMDKTIDILISSTNFKFKLYQLLVVELLKKTNSNDVLSIIDNKIRFVKAPYEANRDTDEIYIMYDDLAELNDNLIQFVFSSYTIGCEVINVCCTHVTDIKELKEKVKEVTGPNKPLSKEMPKLTRLIYDELKLRGLDVESGPGVIDLMIRGKIQKGQVVVPNVGIIIEGLDGKTSYAILEDYDYYYNEYKKHGWEIYIFCVNDIIDNLQDKLDIISSFLAQKNTKSMHQLKIDDYIK